MNTLLLIHAFLDPIENVFESLFIALATTAVKNYSAVGKDVFTHTVGEDFGSILRELVVDRARGRFRASFVEDSDACCGIGIESEGCVN